MRSLFGSAICLLLAATGCSAVVDELGDETESVDEALESLPPKGSLSVERVETVGPGESSTRSQVSARFMRISGGLDHSSAVRLVGSGAPPRAGDNGCGPLAQASGEASKWASAAAKHASIELLDAGDIVIHAGSTTLPLAQRAFPDVGDIVSGVVYSSRDDSVQLPAGGSLLIETSGSLWVDGFSAQIDPPQALTGVRINDVAVDAADVHLQLGKPLRLDWTPAGSSASAADRVFVDLTIDPATTVMMRCVFDDQGSALVPADTLTRLARGADNIELMFHRHRRVTIRPDGVDRATVDFDFMVSVQLAVSPSAQ